MLAAPHSNTVVVPFLTSRLYIIFVVTLIIAAFGRGMSLLLIVLDMKESKLEVQFFWGERPLGRKRKMHTPTDVVTQQAQCVKFSDLQCLTPLLTE